MKLKDFFWTLPFLCFLATYIILSLLFAKPSISTPSLIGTQLTNAFTLLSQHNLNPRLLRQQVDDELPAGTILSQIPAPGQKIKPYQQVFLTVSKKNDTRSAPQIVGKQYAHAIGQLKESDIKHKVFYLASKKPKGTVTAQLPTAGNAMVNNRMTLYVSEGSTKPVLFPDFTQHTAQEVTQFLSTYNITPRLYHTRSVTKQHDCSSCIVIGQQPLPGSIIDIEKPVSVQLKVS